MYSGNISPIFLALALVPAAASSQQVPRQLGEEELVQLHRSVEASKARSIEVQRQAELERKREELRRQEEALAYDDEYYEDDEPTVDTASAFLGAFIGTLNSEMAKKQQEDVQRQRFLDNVRREAEAVDRQRQRDLERQRLAEERARLERQAEQQRQLAAAQQRQAAAIGGDLRATNGTTAADATASSMMTTQQQAAKAREEALRANVAAERQRLAAERERAAAAERERVMRPFVEASNRQQALSASSAGTAAVSSTPKAAAASVDHGPAKAWCRARRNEMAKQTEYQCMGPLQNLLSWYPTLDAPLGMAGCSGGEGYTPTPEHGGSSFNCGRKLKVGDLRMPTYDPYRGGGSPTRVTSGN